MVCMIDGSRSTIFFWWKTPNGRVKSKTVVTQQTTTAAQRNQVYYMADSFRVLWLVNSNSVRQVMNLRFFLSCFHEEKISVHNLPYRPRTRLIRGMYHSSSNLSRNFTAVLTRAHVHTSCFSFRGASRDTELLRKLHGVTGPQHQTSATCNAKFSTIARQVAEKIE